MPRTIIMLLLLVAAPWTVRAGEMTKQSAINNIRVGKDQATIQLYTCHASSASALRDHVNHWLDSMSVELIDIQYETVVVPNLEDTAYHVWTQEDIDSLFSDSGKGAAVRFGHRGVEMKCVYVGAVDTTITKHPNTFEFDLIYRAWITYRARREK